jgi:circadian clock protein KaiB
MSDRYLLKLYVTGYTHRSQEAISNLIHLCELYLKNKHEIVIVDVLEQPLLAETEKILLTPTLIKELPLPKVRIVGDLLDTPTILLELNLPQ